MTQKSLLAAAAAISVLALSFGAQACRLGDRVEASAAATAYRTDRTLRRVGDGLVRAGDRLFAWGHRRPRT